MEKMREQRVVLEISGNTKRRFIVRAQTDIINHPYEKVLDIWKLDRQGGKMSRIRLLNTYNNNLREDHV